MNTLNDTFDDFTFSDIQVQNNASLLHDTKSVIDIKEPVQFHISEDNSSTPILVTNRNDVSLDDSMFLNSPEISSLKAIINTSYNNSIKDVTNHITEEQLNNKNVIDTIFDKGNDICVDLKLLMKEESDYKSEDIFENSLKNDSCNYDTTNSDSNMDENILKLSAWGLPDTILKKYESRNITSMFPWQVECLKNTNVLNTNANLVYSAPTSAGKTLVAEILMIKTVLEREKKVIFILPFVSVVREKMFYFQDIFSNSGVRVEGFMGSYNPPGGFQSVQVAICTIEKANSLINKLLQEQNMSEVGAIVIDEMHLLGDSSRGYLLELLLTKLRYISLRDENVKIQIIGMSATLPNLEVLAKWLDAQLYVTTFRPIPLYEQVHVCGEIYDNELKLIRKLTPLSELDTDTDNILQLCIETIRDSCSVLIFCPTKNWCENLAQQIATAFWKLGNGKGEISQALREQLKPDVIGELLEQLKFCPVGLDDILRKTISFGIAFHHAGLTMDERDIIEGAFRNGAIRVLVATSTLSSGVNLPARRVIIRTPIFHGKPIDTLSYRQMIGRAGRMGKDTVGESILVCQKNDCKIAKTLLCEQLQPIKSCLEGEGKLKRAILEIIASGVASSPQDVDLFTKCTLLAQSDTFDDPIEEALEFLINNEFVRLQQQEDGTLKYIATSLGKACLSSSIPPEDGLSLFTELEKARQCFVLETELHLIYLVTPYSACHQWGNLDWMFYLNLWEKLPQSMKKVGELVGVRESYIVNATRGKIQTNTPKLYHKILVHKRFFIALALQDLVNEKSLSEVCAKFNCNRGMLQSLQLTASTFAGMVTAFSRQLGWSSVEILISQFQDRLHFGVSRDLLDLMRLPVLNGKSARALFNGGLETLVQLANSDVDTIENILHKVPFESGKIREGETEFDLKERNKYRNIWITGKEGLTEREAAELLLNSSRNYLQIEMGLKEAKWEKTQGNSKDLNSASQENCLSNSVKNNEKQIKTDGSVFLKEKLSISEANKQTCGKSSNLNEISTLNISPSSKNNVSAALPDDGNILDTKDVTSDGSLFESSLNEETRFNGTDRDAFISYNCFRNNTSSGSLNSSGDFITTSQDENWLSFKEITSNSSRKRILKDNENDTFFIHLQSPRKKTKISSKDTTPNIAPSSEFKEKVTNLQKVEIVDVCSFEKLFLSFNNEIKQERCISLSVACSKVKEKKHVIGLAENFISEKEARYKFTYKDTKVEGFGIFWGGFTVYYLDIEKMEKCIDLIRLLVNNKELTIKMFDCKEQIKLLKKCCNIDFNTKVEDPKVADWILQPEEREKNLQAMVLTYCPELAHLLQLCGICKSNTSISLDIQSEVDAKSRSSIESLLTWYLTESTKETLRRQNENLLSVYATEMACLCGLAKMEIIGVGVNSAIFHNLIETLNKEKSEIEKKAYNLANKRFSFVSSREIARVLGLPKGRKISTKKQLLEKSDNPISDLILQWRKLNSTITKMIQPLIRAIENERIHGCCIVHTATGRISMHEPNLQNVAKNFEFSNAITGIKINISCRNAFAAKKSYVLLSADYCQLELRLLAHLSKDELLRKIMREKGDVFRSIAAKWNNVEENKVTDNMRQHAKQICYGIIYGMGSRTLGEHLGIEEKDAAIFMETFRKTYPGVKNYIKEVIDKCKKNGFVETIAGRRRYLPHINDPDVTKRSQAERQAINTTIQGSAADVVKRTMIALEKECFVFKNKPNLVLHLHDELLYEVPDEQLKEFALVLKKTMEESIKLSIPFPVKMKCGPSWGQLTEYYV